MHSSNWKNSEKSDKSIGRIWINGPSKLLLLGFPVKWTIAWVSGYSFGRGEDFWDADIVFFGHPWTGCDSVGIASVTLHRGHAESLFHSSPKIGIVNGIQSRFRGWGTKGYPRDSCKNKGTFLIVSFMGVPQLSNMKRQPGEQKQKI